MAYELLDPMIDACHEVILAATFTGNNGIRIGLQDTEDWTEFDLSPEQARTLGEALIRWSAAGHASATGYSDEHAKAWSVKLAELEQQLVPKSE